MGSEEQRIVNQVHANLLKFKNVELAEGGTRLAVPDNLGNMYEVSWINIYAPSRRVQLVVFSGLARKNKYTECWYGHTCHGGVNIYDEKFTEEQVLQIEQHLNFSNIKKRIIEWHEIRIY